MATSMRNWEMHGAKNIANRVSTPASVLHRLSLHTNVQVRMAVADNENTGVHTSMQLAQDDSADLRYALAENHHIDGRILGFLAKDTNPFVAHRAQKTILRLGQASPR